MNYLGLGSESSFYLLNFTRIFAVSVRRSFLFLCVLKKSVLLYCGTPLVFHITILVRFQSDIIIIRFVEVETEPLLSIFIFLFRKPFSVQ